jgi:hypothetical protein
MTTGFFAGTIDIRNSRGVQVGNHQRQNNLYIHLMSSSPDARTMLANSAALRAEILGAVTGGKLAPGALSNALSSAFEKAVRESPNMQCAGQLITTSGRASVDVSNAAAVSIGDHNHQINEVAVTLTAPHKTSAEIAAFGATLKTTSAIEVSHYGAPDKRATVPYNRRDTDDAEVSPPKE